MIRSFLAIQIPRTILKKIEEVQEDLKSSRADVRWVSPEKIHLTLKFFGNIDEPKIDLIVKSIEGLTQTTLPFSLKVQGMGAFPHLKNPKVIWMGLMDEKERLASFQNQLEKELEKSGFQPEQRGFHPHLTLGRMRSGKGREELTQRMEMHKDKEFGEINVERIILFQSDLKPTGPIYTPLRELKLGNE